jgi:hypothetical protein
MEKPEPACQAAAHRIGRRPQRDRERERERESSTLLAASPFPMRKVPAKETRRGDLRGRSIAKKKVTEMTLQNQSPCHAHVITWNPFSWHPCTEPRGWQFLDFSDSQSQRALFAAYVRATLSQSETTSTWNWTWIEGSQQTWQTIHAELDRG